MKQNQRQIGGKLPADDAITSALYCSNAPNASLAYYCGKSDTWFLFENNFYVITNFCIQNLHKNSFVRGTWESFYAEIAPGDT